MNTLQAILESQLFQTQELTAGPGFWLYLLFHLVIF